jgi:hypothetical protein
MSREGEGFETNLPELALPSGNFRNVLPEMVRKVTEKSAFSSPDREQLTAHRILPNKNIGKIREISGSRRPEDTAPQIWLAEGEELGSNLLRVAPSSHG